MITSSELVKIVKSYDSDVNENLLTKAYLFSMDVHGLQKRASGSPYFYHPVEVAHILANMKLDVATIVTGLLHDVLEDTNVSYEELDEIFGNEIASLVAGVTKLSHIKYVSSKIRLNENYKKFVIALSKDIRVLFVKLVDRLHNMRTLNYVPSIEKRKRISLETLDLYAPLAERIGMSFIKDEIEDIAFYNLHTNEYSSIATKLDNIRKKDCSFVNNIVIELQKTFRDNNLYAIISGREKHIYSIWKKMQKRNVALEQINDIVAFRIIVKTVAQCYNALGIIHTNFHIKPGRFKDYISIPKLNNYRSLHTTVVGPLNLVIEVQIRTEEMHRDADIGVAAHWAYKDGLVVSSNIENKKYKFVKELLMIVHNCDSPEEILDNSKLNMYDSEVFCFSPKGDLFNLPRGATAIDFAYGIHTNIGNTCIGVRVNDKMVSLKTILRNGDIVDIITSPYQHPDAEWARFVVTGKAKICIKKFIKSQKLHEFTMLGLYLTRYIFSLTNVAFNEKLIDYKKFSCDSVNNFYYAVANNDITLENVRAMIPAENNQMMISNKQICILDFSPGIAVHFADCCHPILGDKITGVLVPKKGIYVHVSNCDLLDAREKTLIKIKWNEYDDFDTTFMAKIKIIILNKSESFAIITNIISSNNVNINNLKIKNRDIESIELELDINVPNEKCFGELQATLRASENVKYLRRL